jgi:Family of unknown function (DUF6338)
MPTTIEAFIVLILGIAPGFVGIRGYSRRRYKTVPDRDLYALAGAGVVSAIWLAAAWLILACFGNPAQEWGIIPFKGETVEAHQAAVGWLVLAIICLPYPLGSLGAHLMDRIEAISRAKDARSKQIWKKVRKTGFFKPPTAWDRGWLHFTRSEDAGEVLVQMDDGLLVRGGFGDKSQADLSPNAPRLFLESGYGYRLDEDGKPVEVEGVGGLGIYLPGERINAIYFGPGSEKPQQDTKEGVLAVPKDHES